MGLIIVGIVFFGGYAIANAKGAAWYWALVAGLVPAAFCFFFGYFGWAIAFLLLGSYFKISLPSSAV